jgi:hypothetical protein
MKPWPRRPMHPDLAEAWRQSFLRYGRDQGMSEAFLSTVYKLMTGKLSPEQLARLTPAQREALDGAMDMLDRMAAETIGLPGSRLS